MNKKVLRFERRKNVSSFNAKSNELVLLSKRKTIGDTLVLNGLKQTYPELSEYNDITRVETVNSPTEDKPFGEEFEDFLCIKFHDDGSCVIDTFSLKDR